MKLRIQPRNICLQLFILTYLICTCTSQSCTFDSECGLYAECRNGKCFCKYGPSIDDGGGFLQPCRDHCTFDSDCVLWADCDWSFRPGHRCRCRRDIGSSYIDDDADSCDAPTMVIVGSILGIVAFIIFVTILCCVVRRRRRLARASRVADCAQPTSAVQQVQMPSHTYQLVYPVQQYQPTAPPYPGYNYSGYGSCQPPPYSEVAS